jgi:eukaryotic-like serine/threonine-protein kinase
MSEVVPATLLQRYEIRGRLGRGGYGLVYEALDHESSTRVALKELTHLAPEALAQFKQEFRSVREIHHPNLVRLDALFEDQGKWVIAMELVEGKDLLEHLYVDDEERCFDDSQLRAVFLQLAEGLQALHAAGFVHRDVKPANVRVTSEGRVVLLDFGLATVVDQREQSTRAAGLGSVAYMAPEQATSHKVGPAADWYALGVCLYEALTGVLPIDADTPFALLTAKQRPLEMPASSCAGGVPADLDTLCSALLAVDPSARPSGRRIRSVLRRGSSAPSTPLPVRSPALSLEPPAFEGRSRELACMEEAFLRAKSGLHQVVLVEGESGIGKSALVEHFVAGHREALVLRSRCYENELLAYKAFDGAMDELARVLGKLGPAQCEAILPPRAALLARLFPALAAVPALARMPLTGLAADPSVQRLEAFSVFVRLLSRLSERAPVIFAIDDLQWADAESFRLLQAWLNAVPARCMIVATVRPAAELDADVAASIGALRKSSAARELSLSGLPQEAAMRLARASLDEAMPSDWLEIIVRESAGHPLFLTLLARFAESGDPSSAAELTLDLAIAARIGNLSRNARALLAAAAIAGSPLAAPLCGRAAGLNEAELSRIATELCRLKLLRRRRAGEIACFHDRIRRVVVETLPRAQARQLHGELAKQLAAHCSVDPAELARHYEAAGELARAHEVYQRGAELAVSGLAFARAALLLERALKLAVMLELPAAARTRLKIARGHALARSGRSAEAAAHFLEAADFCQGEEQTQLRIFAAQHLLQSGHVAEGMRAARALLLELDVALPEHAVTVLGRLVWDRACLGLRGLRGRSTTAPSSGKTRMQLDALWGLAMPVAWLDPLASFVLITRHMRLAHSVDAPAHMARALAEEAFACVLRRPDDPEGDALLARARALCEGSYDRALDVSVSFREATIASMRFELSRACQLLERAQRVGTESCPDEPWLLTNVRVTLGNNWMLLGEHSRLALASAAWLEEARDRDDRFALSLIDGFGGGHLRHLMADDPDLARESLEAVLAALPSEPFSFARMGEMLGVQHAELYRGGSGAQRWLEREHARLSRAFILKTPLGKTLWLLWRATAALAARPVVSAAKAQQLRAEVDSCVRALQRLDGKLADVSFFALAAQLAAIDGRPDDAVRHAEVARLRSDGFGHHLLARTMDFLLGSLHGGEAGRARQQAALDFFAAQGWKNPRRCVAILLPVIDQLE